MPKKVPQSVEQYFAKDWVEWQKFLSQIIPSKQQPKPVVLSGSPMILTPEEIVDYVISGGTVSALELSRNGAPFIDLGDTKGMYRITFNDELRITYSVAPTVYYLQA